MSINQSEKITAYLENCSLILGRYNEMGLKSFKVRRRMANKLIFYVKGLFKREKILYSKIEYRWGRFFFHIKPDHIRKALIALRFAIGLHSFAPAYTTSTDFDEIKEFALQFAKNYITSGDTFAVRARRVKSYSYKSNQIERIVGGYIYDYFSAKGHPLKVDLEHPDKTIHIEVRQNQTYFYSNWFSTIWGGVPLEPDKPMVALWKGTSDDILSTLLMMRRGSIVIPIIMQANSINSLRYVIDEESESFPYHSLNIIARYIPDGLPYVSLQIDTLLHFLTDQLNEKQISNEKYTIEKFIALFMEEVILYVNRNDKFHYDGKKLWIKAFLTGDRLAYAKSAHFEQNLTRPHLIPLTGLDDNAIEKLSDLAEISCQVFFNQQNDRLNLQKIKFNEFSFDELLKSDLSTKNTNLDNNIEYQAVNKLKIEHSKVDLETLRKFTKNPKYKEIVNHILNKGIYKKHIHPLFERGK